MTSAPQHRAGEVRILHWNIHSWRDDAGVSNRDAVIELVRATAPHVVCLVEVDESWASPSALGEVANRGGYGSIFVPVFEFGADSPAGGFGNALLSRLPIRTVRQRQLTWPPRLFDGSEPSEPRSVLLAQVQTTTAEVWVASTHLPRSQEDTRTQALHRLATLIQQLDGAWLLLGDFNTPAAGWLDAYPSLAAYPTPPKPTYPTQDPQEPIDYCVAPRELPVHAEVLPETGSDHLPLLVSYRLAGFQ